MKTHVHLWYYISESFLEWEMFRTKTVEKAKTHIFNTFFLKSSLLWDNVEKYGRVRHVADDIKIRRMRFACWIT